MTDDLYTRADKFKRWVLNHRDSTKVIGDQILAGQARALIDEHLAPLRNTVAFRDAVALLMSRGLVE